MLFSFVIGIVLGAIAVIFAFQNVAVVTVSFFAWQLTGSLAIVILGTLLCGIVLTLLFLLPSVIRDEMYMSAIKRQKREAEDELARYKTPAPAPSTTGVTP